MKLVEETRPEAAAAAIDAATDPLTSIRKAAKESGLPLSTVQALIKRMETRHRPLTDEIKTFKTKELLGMIEDRLFRALHYLDDVVLSGSNARDLAVIAGVLFDKRQLLRGEPTEIQSREKSMENVEILKVAMRELASRGMVTVVDGKPVFADKALQENAALPPPPVT